MYYSDDIVEEIRSRSDIVDVIGANVHLTKKGNNYWGLCPFHNEHTPSFSVNANKQLFKCFGCGEGGNVFSFVMKYENMTFPEAIKTLADRSGISLPEQPQSEEEKRRTGKRARLLEVNKEAAIFFYHMLRSPKGERGLKYLEERQLSEETMRMFGLGYAGVNGRDVVEYLRHKGFTDEEIRESGIATFSEKNGLSSPFWNRVMYPIYDASGRVIGFGGRVMGDAKPKYLNSPETPIFDKRRNLYGMHLARKSREDYYILCEGYMDVIAMHQAGFNQAVASLGTAFTPEQAVLLNRSKKKALLAYDSDGAGVKAALRAIEILRDVGMSGKVINMRPYKDPDEFMKNLGKEAFQERIEQAENGFFFTIRVLSENYNQSDPEQRTQFQREVAQKLCVFKEAAERENYLQAIAEKYMIGADNLRELVTDYAAKAVGVAKIARPQSGMTGKTTAEDAGKRVQAMLLTWLTDDISLYDKVRKYIGVEDFTEEIYRIVADRLFRDLEQGIFQPAAIINLFEDEEQQREVAGLFQAKLPHTETPQEREKAFRDIIVAVKRSSYEKFAAGVGMDMALMQESLKRKKELEQLQKAVITL